MKDSYTPNPRVDSTGSYLGNLPCFIHRRSRRFVEVRVYNVRGCAAVNREKAERQKPIILRISDSLLSLPLAASTRTVCIRDPRSSPILRAPARIGLECPGSADARVSGGAVWAGRSVAKRWLTVAGPVAAACDRSRRGVALLEALPRSTKPPPSRTTWPPPLLTTPDRWSFTRVVPGMARPPMSHGWCHGASSRASNQWRSSAAV